MYRLDKKRYLPSKKWGNCLWCLWEFNWDFDFLLFARALLTTWLPQKDSANIFHLEITHVPKSRSGICSLDWDMKQDVLPVLIKLKFSVGINTVKLISNCSALSFSKQIKHRIPETEVLWDACLLFHKKVFACHV